MRYDLKSENCNRSRRSSDGTLYSFDDGPSSNESAYGRKHNPRSKMTVLRGCSYQGGKHGKCMLMND
jgi:hypothetical protein